MADAGLRRLSERHRLILDIIEEGSNQSAFFDAVYDLSKPVPPFRSTGMQLKLSKLQQCESSAFAFIMIWNLGKLPWTCTQTCKLCTCEVTSGLGDIKAPELSVSARNLAQSSWRLLGQLAAWGGE
eukprot:5195979-Amphidinium_carterae.2